MPILYVVTVDGQISILPLSKEKTTIGRSKDNDLTLAEKTVSRHHAEILKAKGAYVLSDPGSFNGTKVNGISIKRITLKNDDKIQIGLTKLTFLETVGASSDRSDSMILKVNNDYADEDQQIIGSSEFEMPGDSQQLLIPIDRKNKKKPKTETGEGVSSKDEDQQSNKNLSALERSNKVLFVLYEISRQLNQIHDFHELLEKIMDLIFIVIDADYGFLVLTSGTKEEELITVVIKHATDQDKHQSDIRPSHTLIKKVINNKVALLTSNAMDDSQLSQAESLMIRKIRSAICVPLWRKNKIIGVIQLDSVKRYNQFTQDDLDLLKAIGSQVAMIIEQSVLNEKIREEELMRNRLERFHSPQIVEMILKGEEEKQDDVMEPKELTATILFTDIVGFTQISESMPPRKINFFLNQYFSRVTDVIFSHNGTLDKYIGDGLMAVFGAPMEKEDDAGMAILSALEIRRQMADMMKGIKEKDRFDIRIGINTGRVMAGNIGSPKRMDYTVIGDPVNIASRLESIAQPNQILLGEETFKCVNNRFKINEVGARKVKGKSSEIMVYELIDE